MSNLKLQGDTDSVGPLPNVPNYMPYSGTYNPLEYMPMPFYSENTIYGYNKEESVLSGSGKYSFLIKRPVNRHLRGNDVMLWHDKCHHPFYARDFSRSFFSSYRNVRVSNSNRSNCQ